MKVGDADRKGCQQGLGGMETHAWEPAETLVDRASCPIAKLNLNIEELIVCDNDYH